MFWLFLVFFFPDWCYQKNPPPCSTSYATAMPGLESRMKRSGPFFFDSGCIRMFAVSTFFPGFFLSCPFHRPTFIFYRDPLPHLLDSGFRDHHLCPIFCETEAPRSPLEILSPTPGSCRGPHSFTEKLIKPICLARCVVPTTFWVTSGFYFLTLIPFLFFHPPLSVVVFFEEVQSCTTCLFFICSMLICSLAFLLSGIKD